MRGRSFSSTRIRYGPRYTIALIGTPGRSSSSPPDRCPVTPWPIGTTPAHRGGRASGADQRGQAAPPGQRVGPAVVVAALVRAAGAGQHEHLRRAQVPVGDAEPGLRHPERPGRLVGDALAGEGQPLRAPGLELGHELVDLDPARVPVAHEVGEPVAQAGDEAVLLGAQPPRSEAAEVQRLPEAVAGRLVVVVAQLGALGAGQPAEDDHRLRSHDVRQHLHAGPRAPRYPARPAPRRVPSRSRANHAVVPVASRSSPQRSASASTSISPRPKTLSGSSSSDATAVSCARPRSWTVTVSTPAARVTVRSEAVPAW